MSEGGRYGGRVREGERKGGTREADKGGIWEGRLKYEGGKVRETEKGGRKGGKREEGDREEEERGRQGDGRREGGSE